MQMVKTCQVLVSVGTSGIVTPAGDIPEMALAAGAIVIYVNLVDVSLVDANELMLIGRASEVLQRFSNSGGDRTAGCGSRATTGAAIKA
ncbi:hypothetical protein STUTZSP0542_34880 [Stutzerimonas marianensis]